MKSAFLVSVFICVLWTTSAWATEIYLKNGDKITGVVAGDNGTSLLVQTMEAGEIRIAKSFIDMPKTYPQKHGPSKIAPKPALPPVVWKENVSLGYTQEGGNTKSQLGNFSTDVDRKTSTGEAEMKYEADYSSSDGAMNGKKFYGMLRYAYNFGNGLKWYNFYKLEGSEDYFADIYYRVNPATGVGYWFSNTPDLKANAELGLGFQYTSYRTGSGPDGGGEPVFVPHFLIDKRLIKNLHLSEDLTMYPSLDDFNDYRFRSETDLVNQINRRWSCKISYVDDFNSNPPAGFRKNDYTWITSLQYHF